MCRSYAKILTSFFHLLISVHYEANNLQIFCCKLLRIVQFHLCDAGKPSLSLRNGYQMGFINISATLQSIPNASRVFLFLFLSPRKHFHHFCHRLSIKKSQKYFLFHIHPGKLLHLIEGFVFPTELDYHSF